MLDRYILKLFIQFCEAKGLEYNPKFIRNYETEFSEWVYSNAEVLREYRNYLQFLGKINEIDTYEIGKGKYDSLALDGMEVVSPYAHTLGLEDLEMHIFNDSPIFTATDRIIVPKRKTILTQNPYGDLNIVGWSKVHNNGVFDISAGVFGRIYDKDIDKKVAQMQILLNQMSDDCSVNYDTDGDKYFLTINSERKIKIASKKKIYVKERI